MPRIRPSDRFERLVEVATRVFIASGGFRRTQVVDIAKELGVAKGTIYLYVESKEALFDLCLRSAVSPITDPELPVPTPAPGATIAFLRELIQGQAVFPTLEAAERGEAPLRDVGEELRELVIELYAVLYRYRSLIRLVGASAHDQPELAALWYEGTRRGLNQRLASYLQACGEAGRVRELPDVAISARLITELVHWFAVSRFFDPLPDELDEELVRETVQEAVLRLCVPVRERR